MDSPRSTYPARSDDRELAYEPRSCECCGNADTESLWLNEFRARTSHGVWHFHNVNVICKTCGFVFVSPAPHRQSLEEYYADAFAPFAGQSLDYDWGKRLQFICRHAPNPTLAIEVGGDKNSDFFRALRKQCGELRVLQINSTIARDCDSWETLGSGVADLVCHYFVLEHIPKVRDFLERCRHLLKPGGIMICEVPDLELYDEDMSALVLYEHVNHFSPNALARIAQVCGFELLEVSKPCSSRSYGFAAAFRKQISAEPALDRRSEECARNRRLFQAGLARWRIIDESFARARTDLDAWLSQGRSVILWGANDALLQFLGDWNVESEHLTVIDSDPSKKSFLGAIPVRSPEEARERISACDSMMIFTALHSQEILSNLAKQFGKSFPGENIRIVDRQNVPKGQFRW